MQSSNNNNVIFKMPPKKEIDSRESRVCHSVKIEDGLDFFKYINFTVI